MRNFFQTKPNIMRYKFGVMALAICFSLIVLFGSPLHDHDLDSSHVDLDCISCHLVQLNIGLGADEPSLPQYTQVTQQIAIPTAISFTLALNSTSSRAPPIFCWSFFSLILKKTYWTFKCKDISLVFKLSFYSLLLC